MWSTHALRLTPLVRDFANIALGTLAEDWAKWAQRILEQAVRMDASWSGNAPRKWQEAEKVE